jgi:integrase
MTGKRHTTPTPLTPVIRRYLNFRETQGTSRRTIAEYSSLLSRIAEKYPHDGPDLFEGMAGADRIVEFALEAWPGGDKNTLRKNMSMIGTFGNWLALRREITASPVPWLPKPKRSKKLKPPMPEYLFQLLLAVAWTPSDRLGLMLLGYTGLRRFELAAIQFRHFDLPTSQVYLPAAKYDKTGMQDLGYEVVRVTAGEAMQERNPSPSHFVLYPHTTSNLKHDRGTRYPHPHKPMSETAQDNWWYALLAAADIPKGDWTMHSLRRLAGCRFYEASDENALATTRFMRHESVSTTFEYYVAQTDKAYRAALLRASSSVDSRSDSPFSGDSA